MFKNYFKIAWRNLLRNTTSSFINIGGLAIGMTVVMLIGLWIFDEVSFNRYHTNYDRIAQVKANANYSGEVFTINSHPIILRNQSLLLRYMHNPVTPSPASCVLKVWMNNCLCRET